MGKRPDLIKLNKSKKHINLVKDFWLKRKKRCDVCGSIVSRNYVKKCRECYQKTKIVKIKENASYTAIHKWIKKHKPKKNNCDHCGIDALKIKKGLHLANKNHKYSRNINEWMYLCPKCHRNYDVKEGLRPELKGKKHPMYGKKHNSETRKIISINTKIAMRKIKNHD